MVPLSERMHAGVVSIEERQVGDRPFKSTILMVIGAIVLGSLIAYLRDDYSFPLVLVAFFVIITIAMCLTHVPTGPRRSAADRADCIEADSWTELARKAWLVHQSKADHARGIDAGTWWADHRGMGLTSDDLPDGPRPALILNGATLPSDLFDVADLFEMTEVDPVRRGSRWRPLVILGLFVAFAVLGVSGGWKIDRDLLTFHIPMAVVIAWGLLVQYQFGSTVAEPGAVEFGIFGRQQRFNRTDSVMCIHREFVTLVRRDGKRHVSEYKKGWNDPAMRDLVARWCVDPTPLGRL